MRPEAHLHDGASCQDQNQLNVHATYVHQSKYSPAKLKAKEEKKIRKYALSRFMQFVTDYQKRLEEQFPSAYSMYRIFMSGMKDFYQDMKRYFRVVKKLNSSEEGYKCLSRKELEIYHQMPLDMIRVAPILLFSAVPFTNYVILPLLYLFPRQLLCYHFWTLQQRMEFAVHTQRKRLLNYRPVFRCLQAQLESLQGNPLYDTWSRILGMLGSGVHPSVDDILYCRELFKGDPYSLTHIYTGHVCFLCCDVGNDGMSVIPVPCIVPFKSALLRMYGMHSGWRRRTRLAGRAELIQHMDAAIVREGGVKTLSQEEIRWACFFRGLNPVNMKTDDAVEWLDQWILISKQVDKTSWSLLLHCPILLAYNQPSNWSLIY
uniref:Letm1 RBD domain-containing protein n=1 Tax=Timema douglasi TaxID=61478 RepID=A0A7R8VEA9_TIMDO|nr:unnamed protein product [Timema douglasi]